MIQKFLDILAYKKQPAAAWSTPVSGGGTFFKKMKKYFLPANRLLTSSSTLCHETTKENR